MYITFQEKITGIVDPIYSWICFFVFLLTLLFTISMFYLIWRIFKIQSYAEAEKNIRTSYESLVNALNRKESENENLDISKKYWIFKNDLSKIKNGKNDANKLKYEVFNLLKAEGNNEKHFFINEIETIEKKISGFYSTKKSENILFEKYEEYYKLYYEKNDKDSFKKLDKYFNSILNVNNHIRKSLVEKIEDAFIEYLQKTHHK